MNRRRRRVVLLGSLCAALVVGLLIARAEGASGLAGAKRRWQARPFADYQLVVAQDHNRCQHEGLVRGAAMAVVSNPCGLPNRTVDDLFALIEEATPVEYPCVAHGCACETIVTVEGVYSAQLGFPRAVGRQWVVRADWRHPDFWRYLWRHGAPPSCGKTTFITTLDVLRLTPLARDE